MPYISQADRDMLDEKIEKLGLLLSNMDVENDPGLLNYAIFRLCKVSMDLNKPRYAKLNSVAGVLSCVQNEIYRRIAVPYEDQKISENGDVK